MTAEKFRYDNKRPIRKAIADAIVDADRIHEMEDNLVRKLKTIDLNRYYVWVGYKSLMGFCNHVLKFSRTQSLRIVARVRRSVDDSPYAVQKRIAEESAIETAQRADGKDWEEDSSECFTESEKSKHSLTPR